MIPCERPEEPEVLQQYGTEWGEEFAHHRAVDPSYRFSWKQHNGRPLNHVLLPILQRMTGEHCSYCDGFGLDAIGRNEIDHFCPKSHSPELAYAWKNLYLCCTCCNGQKKERFDSLLLRPDDPEFSFERYFIYIEATGYLEPNPAANPADKERAKISIDIFGLNKQGRPRTRQRMRKQTMYISVIDKNEYPYRFLFNW